jgi:hypothetical protein
MRLGEAADEAAHRHPRFVVQRREGFVEQQDRFGAQQRAGEGDALFLAAGQRGGALRLDAGQPDLFESTGDQAIPFFMTCPARQTECDIAAGGQVIEQAFRLEEQLYRALLGRQWLQVLSVERHAAGDGREEAGDEIEQGGFA